MNLKERQIQELMNLLYKSNEGLSQKIQKDIYENGIDTYELMLLEWISKSSRTLAGLAYDMGHHGAISKQVQHDAYCSNLISQENILITEDMIKNPLKWDNIDKETRNEYNIEFRSLATSTPMAE